MPEFKAKSKSKKDMNAAVSKNMHALKHGKHHGNRTHKQEVAIALKEARGEGKNSKRKAKKTARRYSRG